MGRVHEPDVELLSAEDAEEDVMKLENNIKIARRYLVFAGYEKCNDSTCGWNAFKNSYHTIEKVESSRRGTLEYEDYPDSWNVGRGDWYQIVDILTLKWVWLMMDQEASMEDSYETILH